MKPNADDVAAAGASEEQARLRLQGLQHEVERTSGLVRRLRWLAILLVGLLIALMIAMHLYHVMQYATVSGASASAVDGRAEVAEIRYTPTSAGKVEFVRQSAGLTQTLTEYVDAPGSGPSAEKTFSWSGKKAEKSTLSVTRRGFLFLVTEDLPVAADGGKG